MGMMYSSSTPKSDSEIKADFQLVNDVVNLHLAYALTPAAKPSPHPRPYSGLSLTTSDAPRPPPIPSSSADHAILNHADGQKTKHIVTGCVLGTLIGATFGGRARLAAAAKAVARPSATSLPARVFGRPVPPPSTRLDRVKDALTGRNNGEEKNEYQTELFHLCAALGLLAGAALGSQSANHSARNIVASSGRQPAITARYQLALKNAASQLPSSVVRDNDTFSQVNHLPGLSVYPPDGVAFRPDSVPFGGHDATLWRAAEQARGMYGPEPITQAPVGPYAGLVQVPAGARRTAADEEGRRREFARLVERERGAWRGAAHDIA